MKKRIFAAGVVIVAGVSIALFLLPRPELSPAPVSTYQQAVEDWKATFSEKGVPDAYGQFLSEGRNLPYSDAHNLSHVVGEVLYERMGDAGISVCTPDFGFGCFHAVVGAALIDRGLDVVPKLGLACKGSNTDSSIQFGCIHGIGHGILTYLGNDKLVDALKKCMLIQESGENEKIGGCLGGVFMEYNFRTMQSVNGNELRQYNDDEFEEPCATAIPRNFKPACYYEQASWWRATMSSRKMSMSASFLEAGKLCMKVHDSELRTMCFRGIGNVVGPNSDYKATVMRQWCQGMPDETSFSACYREALGHLLYEPKAAQQLKSACNEDGNLLGDFCDSI